MGSINSKSKTAISITCTTHIVQDGVSSTILVLLPILAQTFGFSYAQVGLLKGAKSLSQAALEFCSGWMSEQIGECRLIIVGLALSGAGYFLLSNAPSALLVTVCLLVIGAGTALHHAPSSALIANSYLSTKRNGALGIYDASGDVGKLAFTGCFSLAIGVGLAWQQISLMYGLVAIFAAFVIAVAKRSTFRRRHSSIHEEPNGTDQPEVKG